MSSHTDSTAMPDLDFTTFHNIVDGSLSSSKTRAHGLDPATGQPVYPVPVATHYHVEAAICAARAAIPAWAATPVPQRKAALEQYASAFEKLQAEFAHLLVLETGKPLGVCNEEAGSGPFWIRETNKLELLDSVVESADRTVTTCYSPLGLVLGIIPWNFPVQTAFVKMAGALLTGNAIILKPSPFAPYSVLKMVELARHFFPAGVVQVLNGDDDLGPVLTRHPGVDKISFTGSVVTGKRILEAASSSLKRVTLELGGNDAAIVCQDVDVEDVSAKIAFAAFAASGQICCAVKRVYVHESVYTAFRESLHRIVRSMKVGSGLEGDVEIGPIQNARQYRRVVDLLKGVQSGDQEVKLKGRNDGYFVAPTVVDQPLDSDPIVAEEQFGPILPIMSWKNEDEVLRRANDSTMGLGASVWSRDNNQCRRLAQKLEAGSVWINCHMEVSPDVPFGGWKESGLGVEGGLVGLSSFCNVKSIVEIKASL